MAHWTQLTLNRALSRPRRRSLALEAGKQRPEINVAGLTGLAGYLIRQAQLWVFEDFNATLTPLALRPAQYSILVIVRDNPGLSQMALSEVLGIGRSGIIPPLDELQSRGLLERLPSSDRRTHALHLTEAGTALLAHADRLVQEHERRLMDKVGAEGHQQLVRVLEVFGRHR
ncbi:MarR family winged helix-turn-helix transcriptional regulator [Bradyrhizobium sp. SRS-191]|uniref:MarR family winged helix-turn-helix transcriptional regulator n=1 Tax=Bradyrhizobium sp. SRS-191 TaxID=2962606 RepID=UPI00211F1169|nr:MarR family transcriptional regulator [Bradyrhizobium sp. SRS-191]